MKTIAIPHNVSKDDRIGSVFNGLFDIINDSVGEDEFYIDFRRQEFIHPFFIAPLAIYYDASDVTISHINRGASLKSYMETIGFGCPFIIKHESDVDNIIASYKHKSYTPICKFVINSAERDKIESKIQTLVEIQSKTNGKVKEPLSYLFSELITNIIEHSRSEYGYIYSQYLETEGCVDICIADKGISIFGSYVQTGKYLDQIQDNPAVALQFAVEGYSTKDRPKSENRGYGISTSIKLLVEGLHGAFFILSGNAFYRYEHEVPQIVRLPESIEWNGTIILLRIPIKNVPADFDCYKYFE